jgi:hypothetical protein
MSAVTGRKKVEFGDFQTPISLAESVVVFLCRAGVSPSVIVEPTCGSGSFVIAALGPFHDLSRVFAFDINPEHLSTLEEGLPDGTRVHVSFQKQDFFTFDWKGFFREVDGEILVLGNPPWVTNATLGLLESTNIPGKKNFQKHAGLAAKTGKANFDISEWILIKLLESLNERSACIAMLCKTAVARKVLRYGWVNHFRMGTPSLHLIDAAKHFGVAVSACLLVIRTGAPEPNLTAGVYRDLSFDHRLATLGIKGTELVADLDEYEQVKNLDGSSHYRWRSGVKHDAASVMEFVNEGSTFINGMDERADLEPTFLFPLLKSSDIANNRLTPTRSVLITQRKPGDDTGTISSLAPRTWSYLLRHENVFDRRRSAVYRKRPRFSMFGVGDYTFSPWKVAVSGLYRNCRFKVIGVHENKPVVVDDTCYFIRCASEEEASFACHLLNSRPAIQFFNALTFRDAKRPITVEVLGRLDLRRLAERLGLGKEARKYFRQAVPAKPTIQEGI